jgi:hypothetical protein
LLSKGGFEFEIVSPRVAEKFDATLTLSLSGVDESLIVKSEAAIALTLSFFATASLHAENISLKLAGR